MRIAVGGFMHESHSFAPRPTRYVDFVQPGGFPKLTVGEPLFAAVKGTSVPIAGAIERAEAIIAASGYSGDVSVDGETVTVTVSAGVGYAFPAPGFPESVSGSATAVAQRGVSGQEGG